MNFLIVFRANDCLIQDPLMRNAWNLGKTRHGLHCVENKDTEKDLGAFKDENTHVNKYWFECK